MVKRNHAQTVAYGKRLTLQLQVLINQSFLHGIKRETVMRRAQVIFEKHADLLLPYVYRSRVKLQVGTNAKNLSPQEIAEVKQKTVKEYLEHFGELYDDYAQARRKLVSWIRQSRTHRILEQPRGVTEKTRHAWRRLHLPTSQQCTSGLRKRKRRMGMGMDRLPRRKSMPNLWTANRNTLQTRNVSSKFASSQPVQVYIWNNNESMR